VKVLVPGISQERVHLCLTSLRLNPRDIIVVDNTPTGLMLPFPVGKRYHFGRNVGVARAWNLGIRDVLADPDETHLVICSQSVVFGRTGGRDLKTSVADGDEWGSEYIGLGWHLNAFSRKFLETFGYFDENFYPAYFEDTDALYRMGLLDMPSPRENGRTRPYFQIDAECRTDGGAIKDGKVDINFTMLQMYYQAKWGGRQGEEKFERPFNQPDADINWWPGLERMRDEL